jgi:4-hydroxybenzoate polyprenyltransferase
VASHLVLGLCLALAPAGAWIAVRGTFDLVPILLGLAVLVWTAGFDILYALQDEEHDRRTGLKSVPARWGTRAALVVSAVLHAAMVPPLLAVWWLSEGGALFAAGIAVFVVALIYQHAIVKPTDLSRINTAFFTANGLVSVTLAACGIADVLMRQR